MLFYSCMIDWPWQLPLACDGVSDEQHRFPLLRERIVT